VLPVVCLRLGLLWLRRRPVAAAVVAAFPPGLAVLSALARATRWGKFVDLAGVWAWMRIRRLPCRAGQVRCGCCPGSRSRRSGGWGELTSHTHDLLARTNLDAHLAGGDRTVPVWAAMVIPVVARNAIPAIVAAYARP